MEPNSRESSKVEQLIVTAERDFTQTPGEPYGDYLDSLKLKEENDRLKIELTDLRGLGIPAKQAVQPPATQTMQPNKQLLYWLLWGILAKNPSVGSTQMGLMWFKVVVVFMRSVESFMETLPVSILFLRQQDVMRKKQS